MESAFDEELVDPDPPKAPPGEMELPSEDGQPMETIRHRQQMNLLIHTVTRALGERRDYFAGGNMFVYFSETQVKKNSFRGPDFFVVLDSTFRARRSWVAWGEDGKLPDVVIELLSDSTRAVDRGEKMQIYSRIWKTAEYFLYDPWSYELEGYRLDRETLKYVPIAPEPTGRLKCQMLGLSLGIREGTVDRATNPWLRWFDANGDLVDSAEEGEAAQQERAETERASAEAERERADIAVARADAAEARAQEAERRLAELLRQSKPDGG
jgi:Uma2 family endonuclease